MSAIATDGPSIATGAYVGLLGYVAGPVAGVAGTGLLVGCGVVWVAIALAAGNRPELWVWLGRRRLLLVPAIAAAGPLVALAFRVELEGITAVSPPVLFALIGLAGLGLAVWVLGSRAYADRDAGDCRASWAASPDRGRRRQVHCLSLLVGLGTGAALVGVFYGFPTTLLSGGLAALVTMQIEVRRTREYEACERGLRYAAVGTVNTQYVPWERFDGLRETDDAVVLERRWWIDERMRADEVPPDAREAMRRAVGASGRRSAPGNGDRTTGQPWDV